MTDVICVSGGSFDSQLLKFFFKKKYEYEVPDSTQSGFLLIAADKGLKYLKDMNLVPDYIVGDFDSAGEELLAYARSLEEKQLSHLIKLNPVKDDTDTEAALNLAFEKADGDIFIFAGMGTRMDHVLSNISILKQGLERNRNIYLLDPKNRVRVMDAGHPVTIEKTEQYGDYVSVFPLSGKVTGLTMRGFYYPLNDAVLQSGTSLGQSNEIVDDVAGISLKTGELIVVESRD